MVYLKNEKYLQHHVSDFVPSVYEIKTFVTLLKWYTPRIDTGLK